MLGTDRGIGFFRCLPAKVLKTKLQAPVVWFSKMILSVFFCFSEPAVGRMLFLVTTICLIAGTWGQGTLAPLNPDNLNPNATHVCRTVDK